MWTTLGDLGSDLLMAALVVTSLGLTAVAASTLWWMLHAWRHTRAPAETGFGGAHAGGTRTFSLLVPARHEEEVLGDTLDCLAALRHPAYEVIAIVGDDDPGTAAVAEAASRRHPGKVRVVVDSSDPKSKPRGLNTALAACRGSVIGVFDAEDEVHPDLLRHVQGRFALSGADVVQGGVQLMNLRDTWWTLRNCLEYWFWFRSRLHFHAGVGFIPLGGNTVFVDAEVLRRAGGWDGDCLAEDCDLGVRLSSTGHKVAVAYEPQLVTREETPPTLPALFKQRTRWNQGFLQVLHKGDWRQLPTRRQRMLARYTLTMPFLQAFSGVLVPISLVLALTLDLPVPVALLSLLPVAPTVLTVLAESAALGDFGRAYGIRVRAWDHIRLVLGTLPYQWLLAAASIRAVWRELRGDGSWEKTAHLGAHRQPAPASEQVSAPVDEPVGAEVPVAARAAS